METELLQTKLMSTKQIANRFYGLYTAGKIQSETQVRRFCVDMVLNQSWGFMLGFGEPGSFTEEDEIAIGTTKVKSDYTLHALNGKVELEAKAITENVEAHVPQLASYAKLTPGCVLAIITNGLVWQVHLVNRNGEMNPQPFRVVDFRLASDDDFVFLVTLFDPKHTVNVSNMRQEQALREKQEEQTKKFHFLVDELKEFMAHPSDEWIKDKIRKFENISSVSAQKLDDYKSNVVVAATNAIHDEITKIAVMEAQKANNIRNRVFAGEYAIYNGARVYCKAKGIEITFRDDDDARVSHVEDATTGRKLMYIIGEVTEETGWTLRGISFPNRTKGRGTIIPLATIEEVDAYFDTLVWVAENIGRSQDEWATLYDEKFSNQLTQV